MSASKIRSHQELEVYRLAFEGAKVIYDLTKTFPKEETYSLTDQIRRSSRSVCANLAEGWRKRRYQAAFISKLSDAEAEAAETQTWLAFSFQCGYVTKDREDELQPHYDRILGMIVKMIRNPNDWTIG